MTLPIIFQFFSMNFVNIGSLIISLAALGIALRISRREQINDNSWETYDKYNSDEVRRGRAVTIAILRQNQAGFTKRSDYEAYFSTEEHKDQRQHYHDLAAFYHQSGLLLAQGHLDKDFTMQLIGPGLANRWNALRTIDTFYEDGQIPYQAIYYLYDQYLHWRQHRPRGLSRRLEQARLRTHHLPHSSTAVQ